MISCGGGSIRGPCFSEPYLGCREFSAAFGPQTDAQPIGRDEDLGVMLHSIAYSDSGERYRWFHARLLQGVMRVPLAPLGAGAVAMPASPGWRADGLGAGR